MSANNNNQPIPPNSQGNTPQPLQQVTSASIQQLALRFTALFKEATRIGVNTSEGEELLKQAAKIKAIYDAYNKQKQQAAQAFGQTNNRPPAPAAGNPPQVAQNTQQRQNSNSANNPSSNIRTLLTPEQSEAYNKLTKTFGDSAKNIRGESEYLRKNIEVLDTEIKNRESEPLAVERLESTKAELVTKLRGLDASFQALPQKFHEAKKKFYIECAASNPNLKRFLQASTQQQQQQQQQQPIPSAHVQHDGVITNTQSKQASH